ncbi:MAG: pilus assembly protein PilM [Candidatus Liptonbacteria bacterium]|nr:pilus assembly protein PilM [Candidatus Liptonbacteria bacterium]
MASVIQKTLAALNPPPEIGGLELSEYAVRFVRFAETSIVTASAPLPPDTLVDGRLNNRDAFAAALANLRTQIGGLQGRKKFFCIVAIPEHTVYTQMVSLPLVADENLEEAATLNLQMIAPGDPGAFYSDWVRVGESGDGAAKKIDILGAFAPRDVVDAFTDALKQNGFVPLAIESPSIALARIVGSEGTANPAAGRLCVAIGTDGMHFVVSKGEELFFNYFVSWQVAQEGAREITEEKFRETIAESLRRVLNFWGSKRGERIGDIVFLTQGLEEQITSVIADIGGIPPVRFASKRFPSLTDAWFVAAGAALRGRISRGQDTRISLMAVGTEDEFLQTQIETFFAVWRTILIAACAAILLVYALTDMFFIRTQNALIAQLGFGPAQPELAALSTLEQEAREFNRRVAFAEAATEHKISWGTILSRIAALRGNAVVTRAFFQEIGMPLTISGIAPGETGAIGMKNNFVAEKTLFENVSMPLSQIRPVPDGVSFTINADIKR